MKSGGYTRSIILLFAFVATSCSIIPRGLTSNPVSESRPAYVEYYSSGKQAYDTGDIEQAQQNLQRCLELNPEYYPAMELLGYTLFSSGEYEEALQQFSNALRGNAYSVNARLGKGRIHMMRREFENAIVELSAALRIDPANADVHFYKGMALRQKGDDFLSWTSLIRSIINDASYRATVAELIPLQESHIARLFQKEYLTIEQNAVISRADAAALVAVIIVENPANMSVQLRGDFQIPRQFQAVQSTLKVADVPEAYWAYDVINMAVTTGIMQLDLENYFNPEHDLTKLEYALILQELLIGVLDEPELNTRYFSRGESFPDLNSSHWAYNAARLCVEYGYLQPHDSGAFGTDDTVRAYDVISTFESIVKMK